MTVIKNICVYCGSSNGGLDAYGEAGNALAQALVKHKMGLVYGGASIGVMGKVADGVLALGGEVIGVIPKALAHKEVAHHHLTQLHVTESMHERKMLMAELSDGFIALPGGIGTFEELFEIWTWAQLGFHHKPIGLLNISGYYDHLIQFLDHVLAEQFVNQETRDLLMVESDPDVLLDRFINYQAPPIKTWLNKAEV